MEKMKSHLFAAFLMLLLPQLSVSYRILFMGPFPAPSHWMWLEQFVNELLNRGHHVTSITNFAPKQPHENYTALVLDPPFDIPKNYPKDNIFKMKFISDFENLNLWWKIGLETSEHALHDDKVKDLIKSDANFDLIILEQFFHESFLMFGHKFNAPIVTLGTMGYADNMDYSMGLLTPWSFIPHLLLSYTDNMTFTQRAYNTYLSLYDIFFRQWFYLPQMQEMAERHFKNHINATLPSVFELEKNISLMLINSHRSIDLARPTMPCLINVGGLHIKPPKALPKNIQDFIDNAKHGVIYFSLGSYLKSTDMPPEKITLLFNAFSKLKQNVLWKYEDESLKSVPKNVLIKKWMPQNDILAHPNVQLFITHGGIFGTQEGIHWAKPMLCIPLFGDQFRNSIKSVREGYALQLTFAEMSEADIITAINKLIDDKRYSNKAKELSALFRDNLVHPLEESMFWIEYVIRNKGAPHLKSHGAHLPFYKYVLLDIFFVFLIFLLTCGVVVFKIIKLLLYFSSNVPNKPKKE